MKKLEEKFRNPKQKRKIHRWIRAVIQLFFFLTVPSAFTTAFSGVKYIFTQMGAGEKVEFTAFVTVLLVLLLYTFVFGRFFCGFACAFGSLGDAVHGLYMFVCKKWKKKPVKMPVSWGKKLELVKYLICFGIALLCFGGVYSKTKGYSPWDVFSMVQADNFSWTGYGIGILLLVLILVGMCVQERFFCRFLCPMGAVFGMIPILPIFSLYRDRENCLRGCSGCTRNCPAHLELSEGGEKNVTGECFQCQKCIDSCPKSNVHCGIKKLHGNEIWFTFLKAIILFLFLWSLVS